MATGECLNPKRDCPMRGKMRKSVGHHLYYYNRDYKTPLENTWRNMAKNIIQRCQCDENNDPHKKPLPKPSLETMIIDLTVSFEDVKNLTYSDSEIVQNPSLCE